MGYYFGTQERASRVNDTVVGSKSAERPMIEAASPKPTEDLAGHPSCQPGESRFDPVTGTWTLFAPHRSQRPDEFVETRERVHSQLECPFCPGNESATPAAVWIGHCDDVPILNPSGPQEERLPSDDQAQENWTVRVVPNKFPAVSSERPQEEKIGGDKNRGAVNAITEHTTPDSTLFQRRCVSGGHEVIIESRNHVQSLTELDVAEAALVFKAYRDRLLYWRDVPGIAYMSIFKNVGSRAGASLRHSHSQLIATDRVPPMVSTVAERLSNHHLTQGSCLGCDLVRAELKSQSRIIWRDGRVVAFCPFSSHLPFLVRVTTLEHQPCYEDLSDSDIESVSRLVRRVVSWIEKALPETAYNFCLHTRPPGCKDPADAYHWTIDIFPRITQMAGFEFGSQCMINPVLPEHAASRLRKFARAEDPRRVL